MFLTINSILKKRIYLPLSTFLFLCFFAVPSEAQPRFSGGISNYNGFQILPPNELVTGYNHFRFILEQQASDGRAYLNFDAEHLYSEASDSLRIIPRELWAELYFDNSDLRIGRQRVNWGIAEGSMVWNRLNPLDLSQFVTRDPERLELGIDALRYTYFLGDHRFEGIINPVFAPHQLPDPDSRWFPNIPVPGNFDLTFETGAPTPALDRMQYGFRYRYRGFQSFDLDLHALYWYNNLPAYQKELAASDDLIFPQLPDQIELTETWRQTAVLGFAGEYRPVQNWAVLAESAWHRNRLFDLIPDELAVLDQESISFQEFFELLNAINEYEDTGFLITRPWLNSSLGVRYQSGNRIVKILAESEYIINHVSEIAREERFRSISAIVSDTFYRDLITLQLTSRYQITGEDFWIYPSIRYDIADGFEIEAGGHFFGGAQKDSFYAHTDFRQFASENLLYAKFSFRW